MAGNDTSALSKADHLADDITDNPYWNESSWFSFSIPERRIHGGVHYFFRANMNLLNGGPIFWDPSGTFQWNSMYYNWSYLQAIPPGSDKYNFTARNSLTVKVLEPLARYKIGYDKEGFELDLVWEAIAPMHQLKSGNAAQEETGKFHFEQPGRIKGTVRRHGQEYRVDSFSMRDGSSGPRDFATTPSTSYFWGVAEKASFHAICVGDGRETPVMGGFIWKDGQMGSLVSGKRVVLEYGPHAPTRVQFEGTDNLGRSMRAIADIDPGLIHTGFTEHTTVWALMKWDWDGQTVWGDNQETTSADRFRRIVRGEIKLGE